MSIRIIRNQDELEYKDFTFPGGEIGIKLNDSPKFWANEYSSATSQNTPYAINLVCRMHDAKDIFKLALVKDAIERRNHYNSIINLILPYVPYGRQDRVCDKGESFSLKVFGDFINYLKFNKVLTFDPHSDVTGAVINNLQIVSQFDIIHHWHEFKARLLTKNVRLVSPDAGANKKVAKIAGYLNHGYFIRADKLRNLSTGEILETIVYADDLSGLDVVILDDLIDGGRTFTELAKVLKKKGAKKVILYITHGIFSKGIDLLFDEGIDEIWTTNSYQNIVDSRVKWYNVDHWIKSL